MEQLPEEVLREGCCPECLSSGQKVKEVTIRHHLKFPLNQSTFTDTLYFYCLNADCDTSYYSTNTRFRVSDLQSEQQIRNKTVCYCFGITETEFHRYISEGEETRFFDDLDALAYSTQCFCKAKNPAGRGCLKTFRQMADAVSSSRDELESH